MVDEKELLMRILEILTRHFDNISAVEASVKSAQWSVYATLFSALVVLCVGLLNFRASLKLIASQNKKAYKDIITSERVKKYNAFRNAGIDVIEVFLNGIKITRDILDKEEQKEEYNKNLVKLNRKLIAFDLEVTQEEKEYVEKDLIHLKQIFMSYEHKKSYEQMLSATRELSKKIKFLLDNRWANIEEEAKL